MSQTVRVKDLLTGNDTDLVIMSPGELTQSTKEQLDPTNLFIVGTVTAGSTPSVSIVGRTVNFVLQQGPQGAKGDKGDTGATGATGAAGANGQDGKSVTVTGSVANASLLPDDLTEADTGKGWITEDDGHLHAWGGTSFTDVGEVRGPAGTQGAKGDTGATGATGPKGDKGDKGDIGIQGATGSSGATGERGERGERGEQGAPGYVMPVDLATPSTGSGSFDEAITNNIKTFQATENGTYGNSLTISSVNFLRQDVFMYYINGVWSYEIKQRSDISSIQDVVNRSDISEEEDNLNGAMIMANIPTGAGSMIKYVPIDSVTGYTPPVRIGLANVVCIGDSNTQGVSGNVGAYPYWLNTMLDPSRFSSVKNLGSGGTGVNYALTQTTLDLYEAALESGSNRNIAVVTYGTNNLCAQEVPNESGMPFSEFKTKYTAFILALKNMGYDKIILVAPAEPYHNWQESDYEGANYAAFLELKKWLKANYILLGADAFASIWDHPILGYAKDYNALPYSTYWAETLHYTPEGYKLVASAVMKPAVLSVEGSAKYYQRQDEPIFNITSGNVFGDKFFTGVIKNPIEFYEVSLDSGVSFQDLTRLPYPINDFYTGTPIVRQKMNNLIKYGEKINTVAFAESENPANGIKTYAPHDHSDWTYGSNWIFNLPNCAYTDVSPDGGAGSWASIPFVDGVRFIYEGNVGGFLGCAFIFRVDGVEVKRAVSTYNGEVLFETHLNDGGTHTLDVARENNAVGYTILEGVWRFVK